MSADKSALSILVAIQSIAEMCETFYENSADARWNKLADALRRAWQSGLESFGINEKDYKEELEDVESEVERLSSQS